jgi:hypothetical protein
MDRVSNRLSRSSSVIYESSHLPDGTYNVSTSAWLPPDREFQKRRFRSVLYFHKEVGIRDHRRERWRDPNAVGSSPREDKEFIQGQGVSVQNSYCIHRKP